jgi:hypothetical protein
MCSYDLAGTHVSSVTEQRIRALLERNVNIHRERCMRMSERSVEEDAIGTKGMN